MTERYISHPVPIPAEISRHGTPEGTLGGTSIRSLLVLSEHKEELMRKTLAALDAEWHECSRSPRAVEALRSWAADEPALAKLADLQAVLRARRDPQAAPGILAALARLAPHDELAARTLLRALMPGLVTMAAGLPSFWNSQRAVRNRLAARGSRARAGGQGPGHGRRRRAMAMSTETRWLVAAKPSFRKKVNGASRSVAMMGPQACGPARG